jgi:hypothetical protein
MQYMDGDTAADSRCRSDRSLFVRSISWLYSRSTTRRLQYVSAYVIICILLAELFFFLFKIKIIIWCKKTTPAAAAAQHTTP